MKQPTSLRVTEHAVLRYLERGMGLDVEAIRKRIIDICEGPAAIGAACVRAEGLRFEILNGAVITVSPGGTIPNRTSQERVQRKLRAPA